MIKRSITSFYLVVATRYLLPLLLFLSIIVLFRGHNEPGGGFAGGIVAASALALHAIANGTTAARRLIFFAPQGYFSSGLLVAACSGLPGLLKGKPFLTHIWSNVRLPAVHTLGTPLLFEIGVYLAVVGATMTILLNLMEE